MKTNHVTAEEANEEIWRMVIEDKEDQIVSCVLTAVLCRYGCSTCPIRRTCTKDEIEAERDRVDPERNVFNPWSLFDCGNELLKRIKERCKTGDL